MMPLWPGFRPSQDPRQLGGVAGRPRAGREEDFGRRPLEFRIRLRYLHLDLAPLERLAGGRQPLRGDDVVGDLGHDPAAGTGEGDHRPLGVEPAIGASAAPPVTSATRATIQLGWGWNSASAARCATRRSC